MKRLLLAIVVMMFTAGTYAYVPMLKDGKQWNELQIIAQVGTDRPAELRTYIREIDGVQDVDGVEYSKFVTTRSEDTTVFSDYFLLLREDTIAQKVYYYDIKLKSELLIYS